MFCTNCGTKVEEGSAHCTSCGAKVGGVSQAAAAVTHTTAVLISGLDENLKKSLIYGGSSILVSIFAMVLILATPVLTILMAPIGVVLGIIAMNGGRELPNRSGYYFGVIGASSSAALGYILGLGLVLGSAAANMAMRGFF